MNIETFRKKYNLSREDLASKVGVSYMTIYRWEKNLVGRKNRAITKRLKEVMEAFKLIDNPA